MSDRTPSIPQTTTAEETSVGDLLNYLRRRYRKHEPPISRRRLQRELAYPSRLALKSDLATLAHLGCILEFRGLRPGVQFREPGA